MGAQLFVKKWVPLYLFKKLGAPLFLQKMGAPLFVKNMGARVIFKKLGTLFSGK